MRRNLQAIAVVAVMGLLWPSPRAHAASKEIIQLQTQVQALQDAMQHLQQSNDERMGVLQHLVEQTADNVNRMNQSLTALQGQLQQQAGGKLDQVSTQIQGLNDSVDELRTRIGKVDTEIQAIQSQLQNVNTTVPAGGAAPGGTAPAAGAPQGAQTVPPPPGAAPGGSPQASAAPAPPPMQSSAPPLAELYQSALSDYEGGRYPLATGEFSDVVKYYPQDELAGNAQFYIGEVAYRQSKYEDAIKAYDQVLEQFSGNPKAPAAQLHKAYAELAVNQKEAGIRDLRSLISRYPQTPEAAQARSRMNGMGVRIAAKPSAYQQ